MVNSAQRGGAAWWLVGRPRGATLCQPTGRPLDHAGTGC